ncbi:MAG: hypothetical protein IT314_08895 [Anaerolineales bacterium]|nr:hypothetical protein [Anaerolineales bacterium]
MEQDNVFVTEGIEPLLIADTVTPSGAVYARQFDAYKATHERTEAFPANSNFQILFNSAGLSGSFSKVTTLFFSVERRISSVQALSERARFRFLKKP